MIHASMRRSNRFSLEMTIAGRNDDYEPDWANRLRQVLAYNAQLFDNSNVDFRVVFVEWNPPTDRPLLSPTLIREFPFVRAITVDRRIHLELAEVKHLSIMLNFAINAGLRTSSSDFSLISGGDVFLGTKLARRIKRKGLKTGCLYRAERVDVNPRVAGGRPSGKAIEDQRNIIRICHCTQPPFDKPPYVNACGDFILMDRKSFGQIRGFDESVRKARVHLDTRCCLTALARGLDCRLIGQIFHLDHAHSWASSSDRYPHLAYDHLSNIPYENASTWGLADREWSLEGNRLHHVS